jgi:hypothetical protein
VTNPKTLTADQEKAVALAAADLKVLEVCYSLLSASTYRAAQRDVLRRLVKRVVVDTLVSAAS